MKLRHTTVFLMPVIFLATGFQSCDTKIQFEKSLVVPAAEGWVKLDKDKNDNYKVELNIERLAEPQRLTPPRNVYIVWACSEKNDTSNIGLLKTESGVFSKELKSKLNTVTPYRPTGIFITAEDAANVSNPGGDVVLTASTIEK